MDGSVDGKGDQVGVVKAGPCGNLMCGEAWEEPFRGFIDRIFVSHGRSIRSIQMLYKTTDGELVLADRHGGQNGHKFHTIQFQEYECINKISGHLSYWLKNVKSLKIETNEGRTYGPYGLEKGTPFVFAAEDGVINGIQGRSSKSRLNAIGVLFDTGVARPVGQTENEQQRTSWPTRPTPSQSPPPQTTAIPTTST